MRDYRLVDRLLIHRQPMAFRDLCAAAIPSTTRFIVLDLDRTLHMARHMGERLGWELGAYHYFGDEVLDRDPAHTRRAPWSSSMYVLHGARVWAYPGLHYLLWGKLAGRFDASQWLRYRRFGASPYTAIQELPTLTLMHQLAGLTLETAARLARRVLDRFAGEQVFDRNDLAWLRARCPDARIILSSASPRPTVEDAARRLGVDGWECTEIEVHDGCYSTPYQLSPLCRRGTVPERISPPSHYRTNAGRTKAERLLARYPELAAPEVEVVGITDTWHGRTTAGPMCSPA